MVRDKMVTWRELETLGLAPRSVLPLPVSLFLSSSLH